MPSTSFFAEAELNAFRTSVGLIGGVTCSAALFASDAAFVFALAEFVLDTDVEFDAVPEQADNNAANKIVENMNVALIG